MRYEIHDETYTTTNTFEGIDSRDKAFFRLGVLGEGHVLTMKARVAVDYAPGSDYETREAYTVDSDGNLLELGWEDYG